MRAKQIGRPYSVRVARNATQSIPTGVATPITFNVIRWDSTPLFSVVGLTRLLVPGLEEFRGTYLIGGSVRFALAAGGNRNLRILLNGLTEIAFARLVASGAAADVLNVCTLYNLNPGDELQLIALQTSSGAVIVETDPNNSPEFWLVKL